MADVGLLVGLMGHYVIVGEGAVVRVREGECVGELGDVSLVVGEFVSLGVRVPVGCPCWYREWWLILVADRGLVVVVVSLGVLALVGDGLVGGAMIALLG